MEILKTKLQEIAEILANCQKTAKDFYSKSNYKIDLSDEQNYYPEIRKDDYMFPKFKITY